MKHHQHHNSEQKCEKNKNQVLKKYGNKHKPKTISSTNTHKKMLVERANNNSNVTKCDVDDDNKFARADSTENKIHIHTRTHHTMNELKKEGGRRIK